ncbi:hypothetical protein TCAL_02114, partial [Tigriopus californicus]|eukprot:TCALIF_02114-PA protein Name:"Similar to fhaB Filamentous hemagglutinin (Bordetella pertussis (strain Tohama I / ATCC BAA-589 / NCTC 13251))" AED:0.20 eAED:0.21 QI:169/0.8/0.66/0.83/0.4/0.5/6/0/516
MRFFIVLGALALAGASAQRNNNVESLSTYGVPENPVISEPPQDVPEPPRPPRTTTRAPIEQADDSLAEGQEQGHHHHDSDDPLAWLRDSVPGEPEVDYPIFNVAPETSFECADRPVGIYADVEARCQVWHQCFGENKWSFLCPNGTIFNQEIFTCVWWFNFDCQTAPDFYGGNEKLYSEDSLSSGQQSPRKPIAVKPAQPTLPVQPIPVPQPAIRRPQPVQPAPAPIRPAPAPVRTAPAPVRPAPAPVRPAPVRTAPQSTPRPVTQTTPRPVTQTTPRPVTQTTPRPETQTPVQPVTRPTPRPEPVAPVQPATPRPSPPANNRRPRPQPTPRAKPVDPVVVPEPVQASYRPKTTSRPAPRTTTRFTPPKSQPTSRPVQPSPQPEIVPTRRVPQTPRPARPARPSRPAPETKTPAPQQVGDNGYEYPVPEEPLQLPTRRPITTPAPTTTTTEAIEAPLPLYQAPIGGRTSITLPADNLPLRNGKAVQARLLQLRVEHTPVESSRKGAFSHTITLGHQ